MSDERHILLVSHTGRRDSIDAAVEVCDLLHDAGLTPVMPFDEYADIRRAEASVGQVDILGVDVRADELEIVIVLGGDGTILRAAELARGTRRRSRRQPRPRRVPRRERARRPGRDGRARPDRRVQGRGARRPAGRRRRRQRDRLLELGAQRGDGREGLPRAHARGRHRGRRPSAVVLRLRRRRRSRPRPARRPTRSPAAAPSCGRRRRAAHGAAERPRPVLPTDRGRARTASWRSRSSGARAASACCGATGAGRTTCLRAPASRSDVRRSRCGSPGSRTPRSPTGWSRSSELPVAGLARARETTTTTDRPSTRPADDRGDPHPRPRRHRRRHARARPGLHRRHRRDRRRQDDDRHRARPAARRPCRRRFGPPWRAERRRRGPLGRARPRARSPSGSRTPAAPSRTASSILTRTVSAEGRSRATVGGRSAPVAVLGELADQLVTVHGQSDQIRLTSADRAARGARRVRRRRGREGPGAVRRRVRRLAAARGRPRDADP